MSRRSDMTDEELKKWFFEQKHISDTGCWEWLKGKSGGYGVTSIKGKRILVHRYSLEIHLNREIPKNLEVRHMCNNPICFNPEHLLEGTHSENMKDMVESNRQAKGNYLSNKLKGIKHPKSNGEGNSNVKLTEDQVLDILAHTGIRKSREYLSKLYGVSKRQIERIQNGKSWKHITEDR